MPNKETEFLAESEVLERLEKKGVRLTTHTLWKLKKKGLFPQPLKFSGSKSTSYYRVEDVEAFERGDYQRG